MLSFVILILYIAYYAIMIEFVTQKAKDCDCHDSWQFKFIKYWSFGYIGFLSLFFLYYVFLAISHNTSMILQNTTMKYVIILLAVFALIGQSVYLYCIINYLANQDNNRCPGCFNQKDYQVVKYASVVYISILGVTMMYGISKTIAVSFLIKKEVS